MMLYRLRTKLNKFRFNRACKEILQTPPIGAPEGGPIILSEVSNHDIMMYLVAIKSLYNRVRKGRIALLLDRDCPKENLDILSEHVRPWKIFYVEDQVSPKCPLGGTWERILTIAKLAEDNYVIQVDSDTVTCADISDVIASIDSNTSFMIGTWKDQEIELAEISEKRVANHPSQHVQILGEKNLTRLRGSSSLYYARGQSSFAGFARGSCSVKQLEDFSEQMMSLLGKEKWSEWGSESFASNFCVANAPSARVLPWPKYSSFYPAAEMSYDNDESSFIHFEGTNRFKHGTYIKCALRAIHNIKRF